MNAMRIVFSLVLPIVCFVGRTESRLHLVDDAGKPVANTRVSLFIDDGVRCVTTLKVAPRDTG